MFKQCHTITLSLLFIFSSLGTAQVANSWPAGMRASHQAYFSSDTAKQQQSRSFYSFGNTAKREVHIDDIKLYAVRGIEAIAALQAGTIGESNNLHLFGSHTNEVGFFLNGSNITHLGTAGSGIYIIPEAIETMTVGTMPFRSSFGGVTGGIINSNLRTAGKEWIASVRQRASHFPGENEKLLGTYSYGYYSTVGMIGGPLTPDKNIRLFLASEYNPVRDNAMRFVEGIRIDQLVEFAPFNQDPPLTINNFEYQSGNRSHTEADRFAINSNLLFDYDQLDLRLDFAYLNDRQQFNDRPFTSILNDRRAYDARQSYFAGADLNVPIGDKVRLYSRLNVLNDFIEREDEFFDGNYQLWYDSTANAPHSDAFISRWQVAPGHNFAGFPFQRNGTPYQNLYFKAKLCTWQADLEIAWQANDHHRLSAGFDLRQHQQRFYAAQPGAINLLGSLPAGSNFDDISDTLWRNRARVVNIGYDPFGEEFDLEEKTLVSDPTGKPHTRAVYLQDKMHYGKFELLVGWRLQQIDEDRYILRDPANPPIDLETGLILPGGFIKTDAASDHLFRLKALLNLPSGMTAYGGFAQFSQLTNYRLFGYSTWPVNFTPPDFFDLSRPTPFPVRVQGADNNYRSNLLEAGLDLVHTSGIYRTALLWKQTEDGDQEEFGVSGQRLTLTLSYDSKRHRGIRTSLHAQFMNAETDYERSSLFNNDINNFTVPENYLRRFSSGLMMDYYYDEQQSISWLRRFGSSLVLTGRSGIVFQSLSDNISTGQSAAYEGGVDYILNPFTTPPAQFETGPAIFQADLNIYKSWRLQSQLDLTFNISVINLFNRRNVLNVYHTTGNADSDAFVTSEQFGRIVDIIGEEYQELYHNINTLNGESYLYYRGRELWGNPRQILLTLGVNFR